MLRRFGAGEVGAWYESSSEKREYSSRAPRERDFSRVAWRDWTSPSMLRGKKICIIVRQRAQAPGRSKTYNERDCRGNGATDSRDRSQEFCPEAVQEQYEQMDRSR